MQLSLCCFSQFATRSRSVKVFDKLYKLRVDIFCINGSRTGFGDVGLKVVNIFIALGAAIALKEFAIALKKHLVGLLIDEQLHFCPPSSVLKFIFQLVPQKALHLRCLKMLGHLAKLFGKLPFRCLCSGQCSVIFYALCCEECVDGYEVLVDMLKVCLQLVGEHR